MTVHHDKMAYGKLASSREELSEEKIALMLKELQREESDGKVSGKEGKEPLKNAAEDKKV